ncbi:MAG: hypothetical protein ACYCZN_10610 [Candidatus Dormibacteria bacterium]
MAVSDRAQLHQLVDELPEASVAPVTTYVRRAADPMIAVLDAAPDDDEPYTAEERAEVEAAFAEADREGWIPAGTIGPGMGAT